MDEKVPVWHEKSKSCYYTWPACLIPYFIVAFTSRNTEIQLGMEHFATKKKQTNLNCLIFQCGSVKITLRQGLPHPITTALLIKKLFIILFTKPIVLILLGAVEVHIHIFITEKIKIYK